MPHRCAFGCKATDVVMHVFPNPNKFPERFKAWVSLVGGDLQMLSDNEIYKKKRICDIHFTDNHRNRFKRLSALAEPSLHLPHSSSAQQADPRAHDQRAVSHAVTASIDTSRMFLSSTAINVHPAETMPVTTDLDTSRAQRVDLATRIQSAVSCAASTGLGQNDKAGGLVPNLLVEHNYSAASRTKRTAKETPGKPLFSIYTKPLQKKVRYLQNEISRLRKKSKLFKERLANAAELSTNVEFQRLIGSMTKPAQLFMHMQQQTAKKPKGRRFTIEEKILSLSLFKKSPKCYNLLCKYFSLPSNRAMKRLMSKIKLGPGINNIIFEKIKKTILNKDISDRLCSFIFDEMSITPEIFYSAHKDQLEGFSSNPKTMFADHVLVFMIKGVKSNFKQPIAYYFTNSLNKIELKKYLRTVLDHCFKSSLIVVNTVCDQSPVNVSAITEMVDETKGMFLRHGKEWRHDVIRVKGHNIVPLYDTPHIIKGLRNNLLTKDLLYVTNAEEKTIKWNYYQMIKEADKSCGELRLLDKITEEHINPEKINKMRVKSATQLFSHSVAVVADHLTARGVLPQECRRIIDFTLLLNNLFDSLNVSSLSIPNGKIFKGPVKRNSPHHELWKKAKIILKTVKYIKEVKNGDKIRLVETVVPSVTNLIKTIEGMENLWELLSTKYGLDAMLTRNFNQDPLENFFGNIRSYGVRNIAPNTVGFEGAFKALLINNFSSPHSGRANCEEDFNECLQSFDFFLREKVQTPDISEETDEIHFPSEICFDQTHQNDAGQSNYVCGWVLRKCLKNLVKGCQNCKITLLDNNSSNKNNSFIVAKEYDGKKWLCYPSKELELYFKNIQNMAASFLKKEVPKKCLKQNIISFSEMLIDGDPFKCPMHKNNLKNVFMKTTLNIIIYSWCRSVNRILSGKLKYEGDDVTKVAAQNYYIKHKNYKNRK